MKAKQENEDRVRRLLDHYGDGAGGAAPTAAQWRHVVERPADGPITLINFFKMRDRADYPEGSGAPEAPGSGEEAFARYAEVSVPSLDKVGGKFLLLAPFEASFLGEEEDWDLVAIGSYPNTESLLALYEDPDYRAVFFHRAAACARQKVLICPA